MAGKVVKKVRFAISGRANILKHQDLVAYVTVVHHCILDAVEALMQKLGQDPRRIDRKSKGFLEVWWRILSSRSGPDQGDPRYECGWRVVAACLRWSFPRTTFHRLAAGSVHRGILQTQNP
jgi:hypothetical protein